MSNVNAFSRRRLGFKRKLSEEEGDFLWILHKKYFKNKDFKDHELCKLFRLLKKEHVFVRKSITFLNGLIGKANKKVDSYIEKSLPLIILLSKVIEKQKEALDNGDIISFLDHFEESDKINIQSYSQFRRRKFLGYSVASVAAAGALAMEYSDLGRMLGLFEKTAYGKIPIKGINYDIGTEYYPGSSTRAELTTNIMKQEIAIIRDVLYCNAIRIYGGNIKRLIECANIALNWGLEVWISPRFINSTQNETISQVQEFAKYAETLRKKATDRVIFVIGNEFTLDIQGFIAGKIYGERAGNLGVNYLRYKFFSGNLNEFLEKLLPGVRGVYKGAITYAAAGWENVDWSLFDIISVNKYLDFISNLNYIKSLNGLKKYGKLIAITEFGCGSYKGAENRGGASTSIVDWSWPHKLNGDYVRDENVQVNYLARLFDIFLRVGVNATFVFNFVETHYPYREGDPKLNLDTASFNLIKVVEGNYGTPEYYANIRKNGSEFRKKSFDFVANFYKNH